MEAGIVGLPNTGKSTLYNALTSAGVPDQNYPFCTIEPNVGVVAVPDARLETIGRFIKPESVTPAALRLVDIAGLVTGASKGEGLGNRFLAHIRGVDAVLHVVRCFESDDVAHVVGAVNPAGDAETVETELMLADLEQVAGGFEKAARQAKTGDSEALVRRDLLERCRARLDDGQPVRGMKLDAAQRRELKSLGLLTFKPVLFVANTAEDDLDGRGDLVRRLAQHAAAQSCGMVTVCAKLEAELAELEPTDSREMLESLGLAQPALVTLTRAAYELLGLRTLFTTRSDQLRAWTVPAGATAPEAAGVIHTDMQRGFIRVEVYTVGDLERYQTEKAIRDAGKLRVEGRDYEIHDGDVCHFLFQN